MTDLNMLSHITFNKSWFYDLALMEFTRHPE